jgi:hypothetical protein
MTARSSLFGQDVYIIVSANFKCQSISGYFHSQCQHRYIYVRVRKDCLIWTFFAWLRLNSPEKHPMYLYIFLVISMLNIWYEGQIQAINWRVRFTEQIKIVIVFFWKSQQTIRRKSLDSYVGIYSLTKELTYVPTYTDKQCRFPERRSLLPNAIKLTKMVDFEVSWGFTLHM